MQWLPISEFSESDFTSGGTFLVFNNKWVDRDLLPSGVTVGYPVELESGGFGWEIAHIDSEGEFYHHHEVAPGPSHFARIVTPIPLDPTIHRWS